LSLRGVNFDTINNIYDVPHFTRSFEKIKLQEKGKSTNRPKALKKLSENLNTSMKRSISSYIFELAIIAAIAAAIQIFGIISILLNTEEMPLIGIVPFLLFFSMALFIGVIYVLWRSIKSLEEE